MNVKIEKLKRDIVELKEKRGAVILAHFYQEGNIQDIADYVGDSFKLSEIAKECKEKIIVFCGVKFMGEGAKILSPGKKVLMPVKEAGCLMADMAGLNEVKELKEKHKDAKVVCYINSSARVKGEADVCCTSSNAVKIVENIASNKIIFLPDKNLGSYVKEKVPNKEIILWDGFCPIHNNVNKEEIIDIIKKYPNIKAAVHPECQSEVREMAHYIGSTSGIIDYVNNSKDSEFLILTEKGVEHQLKKDSSRKYIFLDMICKDMKKTKLHDVYNCLLNMYGEILLEDKIIKNARKALYNMFTLGR